MSRATDSEGLIGFLQECQLKPLPPVPAEKRIASTPAQPGEVEGEREWQDDTPAGKWNKIRSEFMNARTADQVRGFAETMPDIAWLEFCTKMAPKTVDINSVQITAVRIELPPIQDGGNGDVIDIEIPS